ncbi:MAG: 50S ribosomal protein L11 methyltransferase [Betaproteobacteria bacterium]
MSYIALRFDAAAALAEAWSDALLDAGALSVDVSDSGAGSDAESPLYGEPGEPTAMAWPISRVAALIMDTADPRVMIKAAADMLDLPLPVYETALVPEQDWVRQTQAQFGPIEIAPGFYIVPTWSESPDPAALNLRLDPGLAFGTGSHPTTRLCLEWLRAEITGGETVLDYGCGSGILAIAAVKLGAARVTGTDVDGQALTASRVNALGNAVAIAFDSPDALPMRVEDIVVANILANPLILLAPALSARVRVGGRIALSGILSAQSDAVAAAYARWFTLAPWRENDGWVLLTGTRGA